MYKKMFICLLFIVNSVFSTAQSYKKLHFKSILVDTHTDIPTTAIDKGLSFDQDLKNKTHESAAHKSRCCGCTNVFYLVRWIEGTSLCMD